MLSDVEERSESIRNERPMDALTLFVSRFVSGNMLLHSVEQDLFETGQKKKKKKKKGSISSSIAIDLEWTILLFRVLALSNWTFLVVKFNLVILAD